MSTFRFAIGRRYINDNPCAHLTPAERPAQHQSEPVHEWTQEELDGLIAASMQLACEPEARYDYSPILKLAAYTGLPLGELLSLQWHDVDLEGRNCTSAVSGQGWVRLPRRRHGRRYGASRSRTTSPSSLRPTSCAPRSHGMRTSCSTRNGKGLSHRNVQSRGFDKAAGQAGIEGVSFHSLRHAFASLMIAGGVNSTELAKVMGHESSAVTERVYINLFDKQRTDDKLRAAMAGGGWQVVGK